MKLVIAIIKPSRLEEVRQALNSLDVHGMTVTEVKGYGRQKGHSEIYRGTEYAVHFLPKLKIEIAVEDSQSDAIVSAIRESAQTGRIGDGKIFVLDLLAVTRIRTGETGAAACAKAIIGAAVKAPSAPQPASVLSRESFIVVPLSR